MKADRRTRIERWLGLPALDAPEGPRAQLLAYLILGCALAALPLLALDVYEARNTPSSGAIAHLVADAAGLLLLSVLWFMNRSGRTRWAGLWFLFFLSSLVPLAFPLPVLDRIWIVWAIPVVAASFLLRPSASFLFAALGAGIYSVLYFGAGRPFAYNVISLPLLFLLALLAWLTADRQERCLMQRLSAEEALRASEKRYERLVQGAAVGICAADKDGRLTFVNAALCRELGRSRDEMLGRAFAQLVHPEDHTILDGPFREALADPKRRLECDLRLLHRDGRALDFHTSVSHLKPSAVAAGFLAVLCNVSERKRAENALSDSELRFRTLFEGSPVPLWEHDVSLLLQRFQELRDSGVRDLRAHWRNHPEEIVGCLNPGAALDVNRAMLELHAAASKEELCAGLERVLTPQARELLAQALVALAAGKQSFGGEAAMRTLAGEERRVLLRWQLLPARDGKLTHMLISALDISELRRAEQERLEMERRQWQAQKLESLGALAGGVAHDFNNLLLAVQGNLEMARDDLPEDSPALARLQRAEQAARSAAALTRQMLAYSGKGRIAVKGLDLPALVRDNAILFQSAVSANVTLKLETDGELPLVLADSVQIQQVLMNLLTNASEAIGQASGTVTLSMGEQVCDEAYLNQSLLEVRPPPGRYVWLQVSDTGCGMDPDTLRRMFEPFFTTKLTGRGLGMSAVHGILRGHQGAILIASKVGKGTRVRVLLPAMSAERLAEGKAAEKPARKQHAAAPVAEETPATAAGAQAGAPPLQAQPAGSPATKAQPVEAQPAAMTAAAAQPAAAEACATPAELAETPAVAGQPAAAQTPAELAHAPPPAPAQSGQLPLLLPAPTELAAEALAPESAPASVRHRRAVARAAPVEAAPPAPEAVQLPLPGALSGTVLVVDDEQMVCDLCAETLASAGLRVLTAADGMDAVVRFREHADEIGCVLLDLTMPLMDGATTVELLRQIRPDVPIILSSGYDEQEATRRFAGRGLAGFLQKPYELKSLKAELQRLLQ